MNSLGFLVIAALLFALSGAEHEISGRIYNGAVADRAQFNYMVWLIAFRSFPADDAGSSCSGLLISSMWVLTAAHCLKDKRMAKVYLGSVDRSRAAISYTVLEPNLRIHPEWSQVQSRNDIALIRIRKTLKCDNIGYGLMPYPWTESRNLSSQVAVVMGWGQLGDFGPLPNELHYTEMQIVAMEQCRRYFGSKPDEAIHVCASSKKPFGTVCRGDSGGPLVLKETGEVIGITAISKNLCEAELPALFTRVIAFLPWITAETGIFF